MSTALNRIFGCVFSLGVISCGSIASTWASPDDPASSDEVLSKYKTALAQLEEDFKHCNGEATLVASFFSNEGVARVAQDLRVEFAFSGPNGLVKSTVNRMPQDGAADGKSTKSAEQQDRTSDGKSAKKAERDYQRVIGFNRQYSMALTKKSPEASFLVAWLEPSPDVGEKQMMKGSAKFVRCSTIANAAPISQLLGVPGLHIQKVTSVEGPSQPARSRIDFTISRDGPAVPKKKGSVFQIMSGWFLVEPQSRWALHQYGMVVKASDSSMMTHVGNIAYAPGSGGKLKPLSNLQRTYRGEFTSDPSTSQTPARLLSSDDFTFIRFEFGDKPDRDFTLSAFGLPEFGQTVAQAASSRGYPWWMLGAAAALGIIAFLLRRVALRRRGRAAHGTT